MNEHESLTVNELEPNLEHEEELQSDDTSCATHEGEYRSNTNLIFAEKLQKTI